MSSKLEKIYEHKFLNKYSDARILRIFKELESWNEADVAEQCHVSEETVHKWLSCNTIAEGERYFLEHFLEQKMQPAIVKLQNQKLELEYYLFVLHKDLPFLTYPEEDETLFEQVEKEVEEGITTASTFFVYPLYAYGIVCGPMDEDYCNVQMLMGKEPIQIYSEMMGVYG